MKGFKNSVTKMTFFFQDEHLFYTRVFRKYKIENSGDTSHPDLRSRYGLFELAVLVIDRMNNYKTNCE
jgi:hypothetical protein